MSESQSEFDQSVVDVVDEMIEQYGAESTRQRLNARRRSESDELAARATEGLSYLKREVLDE